jgi:hypothetical protein
MYLQVRSVEFVRNFSAWNIISELLWEEFRTACGSSSKELTVYKFIQCWNWEGGLGETPYHKICYKFLLEMLYVSWQIESGI